MNIIKDDRIQIIKPIFIINGSGGSGKDTFIEFVSEKLNTYNKSSIDCIKEIASKIGWDGSKEERDRKFLSDLKFLLTQYNNYPFNECKRLIQEYLKEDYEIMFLHIREISEIKKIKSLSKDIKTILVKRDDIQIIRSNSSDGQVLNYKYDIVIKNDSNLDELKLKAYNFAEDFKNNKIKDRY